MLARTGFFAPRTVLDGPLQILRAEMAAGDGVAHVSSSGVRILSGGAAKGAKFASVDQNVRQPFGFQQ